MTATSSPPRGRRPKVVGALELLTTADERYRAPALDKGLDILELLAAQPQGLTRVEIVKEMDRSANEIYRMLERLVVRQYVMRNASGDRYALSLKLFALAHMHPPLSRLINQALACPPPHVLRKRTRIRTWVGQRVPNPSSTTRATRSVRCCTKPVSYTHLTLPTNREV